MLAPASSLLMQRDESGSLFSLAGARQVRVTAVCCGDVKSSFLKQLTRAPLPVPVWMRIPEPPCLPCASLQLLAELRFPDEQSR